MSNGKLLYLTAALLAFGAGCNQTIEIPHVAEPFGPPDYLGAPMQKNGFGDLPKTQMPNAADNGMVSFKTEPPSLQSSVTVLRFSTGSLNQTEFQNLTHAIGLPAGLVGDATKNLGYALTWTNDEGYIWQLFSNDRRLTFNSAKAKPKNTLVESWAGNERIIDQVDIFLKLHGVDEAKLRNIQILPTWNAWLKKMDALGGCVPSETRKLISAIGNTSDFFDKEPPTLPSATGTNCIASYPSLLPVTFERLVDGWQILDKHGDPEIGGEILVNSQTGEVVSGWMTLPEEPQRSDYSAITRDELKKSFEQGGLAGAQPGDKEITDITFSFVRLPKSQAYGHEYLVPAAVAEATKQTQNGLQPYRIVVPLIKQ